MQLELLVYALLGGILPAILWLSFWLLEDRKHPEPNKLLLKTFFLGMLAVILVIPLQKGAEIMFPGLLLVQVLIWAVIEEVFKFGAGYFGGIHSVEDNEPVDPLVYMVTAALGFVAVENTLFILGPLLGNDMIQSIVTGNLRFIGASLLHVVSSGIVGAAIAFSFYQSREEKKRRLAWGLLAAALFHAAFNLLILAGGEYGMTIAFVLVWVAVGWLLWAFEKSKWIAR